MKALVAAAILVTSAPAVALFAQDAGVTVNAPKQVCRRMEVPASGSRISRRRVCMTAAQWRARSGDPTADAEDALDTLNREDPGHQASMRFSSENKGEVSPK